MFSALLRVLCGSAVITNNRNTSVLFRTSTSSRVTNHSSPRITALGGNFGPLLDASCFFDVACKGPTARLSSLEYFRILNATTPEHERDTRGI
jgi:hypothetical protein